MDFCWPDLQISAFAGSDSITQTQPLSLAGGRSDFKFYFFLFSCFFLLPCHNLKLALLPSQALSFCAHCWLSKKCHWLQVNISEGRTGEYLLQGLEPEKLQCSLKNPRSVKILIFIHVYCKTPEAGRGVEGESCLILP